MNPPRIGLWRAVSSEEQAEKYSLEHQDRQIREHAAKWGGVIVAEMEVAESRDILLWEEAVSRVDAYAQLDDLIKRRAIDILMCYDATRLGRHNALVVNVAAVCERAGIRVYETQAPPPTLDGPHSTADGRLLMLLKSHMAHEETRKTSERAMFGRSAQVRKGKHANTPPAGLKRIHDPLTGEGRTVHDEEWIDLIHLFYTLYLDHGRSQRAIASEFSARGYVIPKTNKTWDEASIRVFLRNRWAYAGYVTWAVSSKKHQGFRAKAEWEPIISEEIAQRAEDEMNLRSKMPRTLGATQRFSATSKCATCGKTLATTRHKKRRGGDRLYYRCRRQCLGALVPEWRIYAAIRDTIIALQDDAQLQSILAETPTERPDLRIILDDSQRALEQVNKERHNLTIAFMREAIRLDEYEGLMADLRQRFDSISFNIADLEKQLASIPSRDKRRQQLEHIRNAGLEMLDHPDPATANAWIRLRFRVFVAANIVQAVELL